MVLDLAQLHKRVDPEDGSIALLEEAAYRADRAARGIRDFGSPRL